LGKGLEEEEGKMHWRKEINKVLNLLFWLFGQCAMPKLEAKK
jgi:hypothetical protein